MKLGKHKGQAIIKSISRINDVVYHELDNTEYGKLINYTWIIASDIIELINYEITYKQIIKNPQYD